METVTRDMQVSLRRYHLERKIFFQLMELKRLQIRHGRANEHVLVKRQVNRLSPLRRSLRLRAMTITHESAKRPVGSHRFSIFFRWKPFIDRACLDLSSVSRDTIDS
jgi:hypothetical protein